jgi:hypothetical protein
LSQTGRARSLVDVVQVPTLLRSDTSDFRKGFPARLVRA